MTGLSLASAGPRFAADRFALSAGQYVSGSRRRDTSFAVSKRWQDFDNSLSEENLQVGGIPQAAT